MVTSHPFLMLLFLSFLDLALYPKWAGCWRQLGSVFTAVTDPILDYQLVGYKQPHLKCAIVAHDRQTSHFALR